MAITTSKGAYREGRARGKSDAADWEGDWDLVPSPLCGEWEGQSIPDIFGSWDNATEDRMDAYDMGYTQSFVVQKAAIRKERMGIS